MPWNACDGTLPSELGGTIRDGFLPASQWNAQCPACVFHFIHRKMRVKRYRKGMSLEVTSIGFVGTNPESTPLPGVDYSKNQEVYEEKRHKAPIAVEPERERKN